MAKRQKRGTPDSIPTGLNPAALGQRRGTPASVRRRFPAGHARSVKTVRSSDTLNITTVQHDANAAVRANDVQRTNEFLPRADATSPRSKESCHRSNINCRRSKKICRQSEDTGLQHAVRFLRSRHALLPSREISQRQIAKQLQPAPSIGLHAESSPSLNYPENPNSSSIRSGLAGLR